MEKAIKRTQELIKEENPTKQENEEHMDKLKPAINNLLHTFLPDEITIKEAEILGIVISEMIWNPNTFLNANKEN